MMKILKWQDAMGNAMRVMNVTNAVVRMELTAALSNKKSPKQ
jgi:hypothetical protein